MKRALSFVLAMAMAITLFSVLSVAALNPGDPLGWVLNSNVTAYIDGYPIRSYNINGYTYIVAEDLLSYGFNVEWRGSEAKLIIHKDRTAVPSQYTATYQHTANTEVPGTPAFQYYYTNITAWIEDQQITGYNIGGNTCICMDDLANAFIDSYDDYVWHPEKATLRLVTAREDSNQLTKDDISIKLKIPRNGAYNNHVQLEVRNYSDIVVIMPEFVSVNGYLCNLSGNKMVSAGYTETLTYYRAPIASKRYDNKYYDMYLDNNSTGYAVMQWYSEQYYAEYGVDGITVFYKGNVNGPAK